MPSGIPSWAAKRALLAELGHNGVRARRLPPRSVGLFVVVNDFASAPHDARPRLRYS